MPNLGLSVEDEQKAFEVDVAAIEKQWASPRQYHLKRYETHHDASSIDNEIIV
jgi:isocitrate lyase